MKKYFFFVLFLVMVNLSCKKDRACNGPQCASKNPSITFLNVPELGDCNSAILIGQVLDAVPASYAIVIYINVVNKWWIKPYADQRITPINDQGIWLANICTGGVDYEARTIKVFLVPYNFSAFLPVSTSHIPTSLYAAAVVEETINR